MSFEGYSYLDDLYSDGFESESKILGPPGFSGDFEPDSRFPDLDESVPESEGREAKTLAELAEEKRLEQRNFSWQIVSYRGRSRKINFSRRL